MCLLSARDINIASLLDPASKSHQGTQFKERRLSPHGSCVSDLHVHLEKGGQDCSENHQRHAWPYREPGICVIVGVVAIAVAIVIFVVVVIVAVAVAVVIIVAVAVAVAVVIIVVGVRRVAARRIAIIRIIRIIR